MNSGQRLLAILVSIPLVLMACAGQDSSANRTQASQAAATAPKRITAGLRGDPANFSDQLSRSGAGRVYGSAEVERLLNSGLQVWDSALVLRPVLAEEVPSIENGLWQVFPDGRMVTTWKIKPNVLWHDGAPFTSADLLFTIRVVMDPDMPEWSAVAFNDIDSVSAPDPSTIAINWKRPFIFANETFMGTVALPQPRHLLEQAYLENKASYTSHPFFAEGYVGTGPYRLQEFVRGSHVILQANDRYTLGRPRIDTVEVKFFQDANALAANILAGEVDLILNGSSLTLDQAAQILERWDGTSESILGGAVGAFPQFMDPSPRVMLDVNFRRAMLHAVDRQSLVDNLQFGLTQVAHTNLTPTNPEFRHAEPRLVKYAFDPSRATQLIDGLGYRRGADGIYRDAANQPLRVEIRSTPGREVNEAVTLAVADMWQRVGVAVDLVVLSAAQNRDREYRQTRSGFEVVGQPEDIYRLHSREIPTPDNRFVGDNRMRYADPQLDQWVDRYYITIPTTERAPIVGQIYQHLTDQVVLLPFFYEATQLLQSKKLVNFTSPLGWNAQEWDVRS